MIEDMDKNIGRLVDYLKQLGEYNNTLIVFTSDNGGSEAIQLPVGVLLFNGVDYSAIPQYVTSLNHTLPNLGNLTTNVNYGAWGSHVSLAPLSGFKAGLYEGGTRAPFIIRTPTVTAAPSTTTTATNTISSPINSLLFVTDITPTFLDYAGVQHPGSTYIGHEVHPIMGESMKPILNSSAESIHGPYEAIGSEMFNSTGVYKGPWVALRPGHDPTGKWQLYNIVTDPAQNNNLAQEHPDIVQQMMTAYQNYAEVGVVIPTGEKAKIQYSKVYPPLNQTQTIELDEIVQPFKRPNATDLINAVQGLQGAD